MKKKAEKTVQPTATWKRATIKIEDAGTVVAAAKNGRISTFPWVSSQSFRVLHLLVKLRMLTCAIVAPVASGEKRGSAVDLA